MTTFAQPELQFGESRRRNSASDEAHEARLNQLLEILADRRTWITRRELETLGFGERELRALSESDERIFSYPGSPGYKHFDHVSETEFDPCIALKNQGRKMLKKWLRYQRRWHKRFKLPAAPLHKPGNPPETE